MTDMARVADIIRGQNARIRVLMHMTHCDELHDSLHASSWMQILLIVNYVQEATAIHFRGLRQWLRQ
jgi:hypothetical protein